MSFSNPILWHRPSTGPSKCCRLLPVPKLPADQIDHVSFPNATIGRYIFAALRSNRLSFFGAHSFRKIRDRTEEFPIGAPWESEKELQTRVSHYLRDMERDGLIGAGTTLHGLRVSYAAWWKRNGANNSEVADLLGDKSERMGAHYTRHVDAEANVIRAFERIKDRK
jgi:integrase